MYKHSALSIKETNDKIFASLEDKNKISKIPAIKNSVSELKSKHSSVNEQLNTLDEYIHNNDTVIYDTKEDTSITVNNSMGGYINNIEILGNTVQDSADLTNIKSVGKLRSDGLYEMNLLSCGKNLFDINSDVVITGNVNNTILVEDNSITLTSNRLEGANYIQFKPIELTPGKKYVLSCEKLQILSGGAEANPRIRIAYKIPNTDNVSSNFKTISYLENSGKLEFSVTEDTKYISIGFYTQTMATSTIQTKSVKYSNVMISEVGLEGDKYEPYQESISNIILPCKLEKVGTVQDRLFKKDNGRWYIEKNIGKTTLTGNENWRKLYEGTENFMYEIDKTVSAVPNTDCLSNRYVCTPVQSATTGKGIYITTSFIRIRPETEVTVEEFKENMIRNNVVLYYIYIDPQVIELPLTTQIQLNSYFGVTNICVDSGEVDAIIKCEIPKSLGGSLNSLNDKTNILATRIKNIENLQEGNDITITTSKGYSLCKDTRDGYIKDIKIEGNTIFNLWGRKASDFTISGQITFNESTKYMEYVSTENRFSNCFNTTNKALFKPNTEYTIIAEIVKNTFDSSLKPLKISSDPGSGGDTSAFNTFININGGFTGVHVEKIRTLVDISTVKHGLRTYIDNVSLEAGKELKFRILILEGDHTNNPPDYFQGILSTGQNSPSNITLISNNKNLGYTIEYYGYYFGYERGTLCVQAGVNSFMTPVEPNTTYYITNAHSNLTFWDKDNNFISGTPTTSVSFTTPRKCRYIRYAVVKDVYNVQVECGSINTNIIDSKNNKKQILYKNTEGDYIPVPALRKVNENIKDSIEKHSDGKYYYHKRCKEVLLNGSEGWKTGRFTEEDEYLLFELENVGIKIADRLNVICDRFVTKNAGNKTYAMEAIQSSTVIDIIWVKILKSRLNTQDVSGFKTWLVSNPLTTVYELANEEVYECNDIELNSYDSETIVSLASGIIPPSILSFKTTSHIGNILTEMKEEVYKNTKFREELTESITITKEFENGYGVIEDTKEGVISIDKIEGSTLVNLGGSVLKTFDQYKVLIEAKYQLKPLTTYTFIVKNKGDASIKFYSNENLFTAQPTVTLPAYNSIVFTRTTLEDVTQLGLLKAADVSGSIYNIQVICIEGHYSNGPLPVYFEGLKSVGESDNKIEIISKNDGNIFNGFFTPGYRIGASGQPYAETGHCITDYLEVFYGETYYINKYNTLVYIGYYDKNKNLIRRDVFAANETNAKIIPTFDTKYVRYSTALESFTDLYITKSKNNYMLPIKQNVKNVVYKNNNGEIINTILRGIPNGVKDSIEKHSDGKYYYYKRCGQLLLNGTENWILNGSTVTDTHIHFWLSPTKPKTGLYTTSDLFRSENYVELNKECFFNSASRQDLIYISILKSKLTSTDVTGLKSWLAKNPVQIVYQLATVEIYECADLDISSFNDKTTLLINSDIRTKLKISTHRNLSNTLNSIKNRVNNIENNAMILFKLLLSGDTQSLAYKLYPEDFSDIVETV